MSLFNRITDVARTASPEQPRCATPLRPNAGLIGRIPVAPSRVDDDTPRTSPGGGPTPRMAHVLGNHAATSTATFDAAKNATIQSITSEGGTRYTIHESSCEDAYSGHEKALISEVNLLRSDPQGYARIMERDVTITRPFVPTDMTLKAASGYLAQLEQQKNSAAEQLDDILNQKKKEIATLYSEWVAEDVDRAKKAKKAMPKKGATPDPEMDTDRSEILQALEKRYSSLQRDLTKTLETSTAAHQAAAQGVQMIRDTVVKLQSIHCGSLPPVAYNRGLSLAAREACIRTNPTAHEVQEVSRLYGEVGSRVALAQHVGVTTVRQTIMEMLMGLQEPLRKQARHTLLDPAMKTAGSGWRKRSKTESVSMLVFATSFEELDAIHARPYLSLDDVRRMLPLAAKSNAPPSSSRAAIGASSSSLVGRGAAQSTAAASHGGSGGNGMATIITLHAPLQDVELISPTSHPVSCGNSAMLTLRCASHVQLCASLGQELDPTPAAPVSGCGDILIQHTLDEGIVEVRVVLPAKGLYKVFLFAKYEHGASWQQQNQVAAAATTATPAADTLALSSSSPINASPPPPPPPPPPSQSSSGFHYIGAVRLHATNWHSLQIVQPFPTVTADFDVRRCTLIGPLESCLRCDEQYTFEVVVPITDYLQEDIHRIENTILETTSKLNGAGKSGSGLKKPPQAPAVVRGGSAVPPTTEAGGDLGAAGEATDASKTSLDELEAAHQAVATAKSRRDEEMPNLLAEIATQNRELAKKKGKELERAKTLIQELEDQLEALEVAIHAAEKLVAVANEKQIAQRRAERRAAAQLQRFQREKRRFEEAADRRQPLRVQLSLEERRADFASVDHENTVYRLTARMPREEGPVTVFINGLAAVMYHVE